MINQFFFDEDSLGSLADWQVFQWVADKNDRVTPVTAKSCERNPLAYQIADAFSEQRDVVVITRKSSDCYAQLQKNFGRLSFFKQLHILDPSEEYLAVHECLRSPDAELLFLWMYFSGFDTDIPLLKSTDACYDSGSAYNKIVGETLAGLIYSKQREREEDGAEVMTSSAVRVASEKLSLSFNAQGTLERIAHAHFRPAYVDIINNDIVYSTGLMDELSTVVTAESEITLLEYIHSIAANAQQLSNKHSEQQDKALDAPKTYICKPASFYADIPQFSSANQHNVPQQMAADSASIVNIASAKKGEKSCLLFNDSFKLVERWHKQEQLYCFDCIFHYAMAERPKFEFQWLDYDGMPVSKEWQWTPAVGNGASFTSDNLLTVLTTLEEGKPFSPEPQHYLKITVSAP